MTDLKSLWQRLPMVDFEGEHQVALRLLNYLNICLGFYESLRPSMNFGPRFQRVVRCHGGPLEVVAEIEGLTADDM